MVGGSDCTRNSEQRCGNVSKRSGGFESDLITIGEKNGGNRFGEQMRPRRLVLRLFVKLP